METWSYVSHENIDREKFKRALNKCVINSDLYAQEFVWDTLHPNWDLLVYGDYQKMVPLPYKRKWFYNTYRQPIFVRTIPLIGDFTDNDFTQIKGALEANSKLTHLNFSDSPIAKCAEHGIYQYLVLQNSVADQRALYGTNARRIIKKNADVLTFGSISESMTFLNFFRDHVGHKYGTLSDEVYERLKNLMEESFKLNIGRLEVAYHLGKPIAMVFYIDFNGIRYYIKGASNETAKELGAMFHLIDKGIADAVSLEMTGFDFVGSNQKGLADFNKKFGAVDRFYGVLKENEFLWPMNRFVKP
ncbi:MAG: GNAT family N-acetyltransferase [Crocinitomicaceae bacterium]|jgi:hypothetical protein|tara:strand:- start:32072 stop:32977 length:906 start_codon:yes stop_codon:yes gene_type:complete